MAFPTSVATGKGGKVLINTGDGALLTLQAMTKQTSYTYKGTSYTNRVYLLGTGKTLINARPAIAPTIYVDGIVSGLDVSANGSNDEFQVSAGVVRVSGTDTTVAADTSVAFSRPAATQGAWIAISVNKSTGAFTATKGTDTADAGGITGLLDTWGAAAGQRPLIPVADLLVGLLKVTNGAALLLPTEIFYYDREWADVDAEPLYNIGGCLLNSALVVCHTGPLARSVLFTGYYLDNVLAEIGTAKEWSLQADNNTVSETTMGRTISITETSGWSFTFSQLATDQKVANNLLSRQGHCAVRLQYSNGGYWQSVGSFTASFKNAPGALNSIDVSGSLGDDPVFV
jgi:hypothetical protein